MKDNSNSDYNRAKSIINALFEMKYELKEEFEHGYSIFDIEQHVNQFMSEIKMLEGISASDRFPAFVVNDGLKIPVSLSFFDFPFSNRYFQYTHSEFFGFLFEEQYKYVWYRYLRENLYRINNFIFISFKEARESFIENATKSLACRIAAVGQSGSNRISQPSVAHNLKIPRRIGAVPKSTPGCLFTVTSNSPGLRVFWSGAYYITSHYFGAPTSPATSVLQSGTYIFGVDGGAYGSTVQWDKNAVCSLPGQPYVHLNY